MKKQLRNGWIIWAVVTALILVQLAVIYLRNGMTGINLFIQQWSLSNLTVTLEATAYTWLAFGALMYLLWRGKINKDNALLLGGMFLIVLLYMNILRERFRYGDYQYYLEAATALYHNQPLPDTYLYLPLWGTLLQFIVPLGDQGMLGILWTANILALGAFYVLLVRVLERYEFTHEWAAGIAFAFLLINTPLHRALGYVQVNLLTMTLILYAMLHFGKRNFLSALALALAVHLKTSPAALLPAFLIGGASLQLTPQNALKQIQWKWMFFFALSFLLIACIPLALEGAQPYFDYLANIRALTRITDTNFHDTSFDSFFRFLNPFFGIGIETTRRISLAAKALLAAAALFVMARNVRAKTFSANALLNALPALFVLMTLASPIVWDHHGLFTALAFLPLLKRIHEPAHWLTFGFAYFLEFILPSFDFFPWSYGRLLAPLLALWLMERLSRSESKPDLEHLFHANERA
ncbi:MAG: hypothetical protein Fur002_07110 [Anaerolineales bacterium]